MNFDDVLAQEEYLFEEATDAEQTVPLKPLVQLLHIHWFKFHHRAGQNIYSQCRCGKRRWMPVHGGYSAVDLNWIRKSNAKNEGLDAPEGTQDD